MIFVHEGVGDGQQAGLFAAVLGEGESGNAADVGDVAAHEQVVQDLVFAAQHAAGLDVDHNGAAGELFHLGLEGLGHFAHDGAVQGVHFSIGQGDGILGQRGGAAKQHSQYEYDAKKLFHWGFLLYNFLGGGLSPSVPGGRRAVRVDGKTPSFVLIKS